MQKRHFDYTQYFEEQSYTTLHFVIPYFEKIIPVTAELTVLEIGCGEGGNLKPFVDLGCRVTGIDLNEGKIKMGEKIFDSHPYRKNISLIYGDIYLHPDLGKFDLIILRDVIEHLPDQDRFMGYMKNYLHPTSLVYFGFPPWQNPFGGHQQMCKSRILSKMPYFHLLPGFLYKGIMKVFGESQSSIENLMEVKSTGISIERFEKILSKHSYQIDAKTYYFINPNYQVKFGLKPRKQNKLVAAIPWLRNFFTTAAYYLVSNKNV